MFYYTYKITLKDSDKFYVGRHQSNISPEKDKYFGSGLWVKSIKDKTRFVKQIINYYNTEEDLIEAERDLLRLNFGQPNCMNMNENPVGFSTKNHYMLGKHHSKERKEQIRLACKNIKLSEEAKDRVRKIWIGRKHSDKSKEKMRLARTKIKNNKWTPEQRTRLSETRKEEYKSGSRKSQKGFLGKSHTDKTKDLLKIKAKNRIKETCPYCHLTCNKSHIVRWHGDKCKMK